MGGDGGSIPTRDDLVRTKQRTPPPDQNVLDIQNWFFCALSKEPLKVPVVADMLGRMYNKSAIIEFLLNRKAFGDGEKICRHIGSLKDVTLLQLCPNPSLKPGSNVPVPSAILRATTDQDLISSFVCPITLREMGGKYRLRDRVEETLAQREEDERLKREKKRAKKEEKRKAKNEDVNGGGGGGKKVKMDTRGMVPVGELEVMKKTSTNITIPLPGLEQEVPKHLQVHSDAVKSIYRSSTAGNKDKGTWMTKGTFNRYV